MAVIKQNSNLKLLFHTNHKNIDAMYLHRFAPTLLTYLIILIVNHLLFIVHTFYPNSFKNN